MTIFDVRNSFVGKAGKFLVDIQENLLTGQRKLLTGALSAVATLVVSAAMVVFAALVLVGAILSSTLFYCCTPENMGWELGQTALGLSIVAVGIAFVAAINLSTLGLFSYFLERPASENSQPA